MFFLHDTVNVLSDLARERIRRAGVKLTSETEMLSDDLDVGFRSLRVSDTNLADILNTPDDLVQTTLEQIVGTIKPGRTPEDLLFQVLLDGGVELSLPIEVVSIGGHEVFFVDGDALIACFEKSVTPEVVRAIAVRKPLRAVFRDDAFGSDAARINAEQVFRELSPVTEVRTI